MKGQMFHGNFATTGEAMEAIVKGLTETLSKTDVNSGEAEIYDFEGFKVVIHVSKQPVKKQ
jgi:hypothetical protein